MNALAAAPSTVSLFLTHWHAEAGLDLAAACYLSLYLWGVARVGPRRWGLRRTLFFVAAVGVVLVALQSGIDTYDERLLSVHMVQHMLLLMLAPPLLLLARPVHLALKALPPGGRLALVQLLRRLEAVTRPASCLAIFTVVLFGTHSPPFFDLTIHHQVLHALEHALFLIAGVLVWWPLLGDDPLVRRRLGGFGRIIYMVAAMPPMAVIGAYLNRATSLVYSPYAAPARALGINPVVDQQFAGAIMWVVSGCLLAAGGIWAAMAAMGEEEHRLRHREDVLRRAA